MHACMQYIYVHVHVHSAVTAVLISPTAQFTHPEIINYICEQSGKTQQKQTNKNPNEMEICSVD